MAGDLTHLPPEELALLGEELARFSPTELQLLANYLRTGRRATAVEFLRLRGKTAWAAALCDDDSGAAPHLSACPQSPINVRLWGHMPCDCGTSEGAAPAPPGEKQGGRHDG